MSATNRINPRVRAYGKARIDITQRAKDEAEWLKMWKEPSQPYPFIHGNGPKLSIDYKVDDYPAEIGFFIDVLGFRVWAFSPSAAQFTNHEKDLFFSVSAARPGEQSAPPGTLRLNIQVSNLDQVVAQLEQRGVVFDQPITPQDPDDNHCTAGFRTPHGVLIVLWGQMDHKSAVEGDMASDEQEDTTDELEEILLDEPEDEGVEYLPEAQKTSDVPVEVQALFWQRMATSNREATSRSRLSVPPLDQAVEQRGNGNGELTYTPVEDGEPDLDDTDSEEDFP
jgi:catechol 2,3-dioxygenase-like lactoylglutathione lyase family enzyme